MHKAQESEQFVRTTLNPGLLEAELQQAVDGEVRFDSASRALYATDASNYRQIPIVWSSPAAPTRYSRPWRSATGTAPRWSPAAGGPGCAARPATSRWSSTIPST